MKSIVYSLTPILLITVILTCATLKFIKIKLGNVFQAFYFLCFFFHQNILSSLFQIVNCAYAQFSEDDADSSYFLKNSPNYTCYTNNFWFWISILFVPSVILYGICMPFITKIPILSEKMKLLQDLNDRKYMPPYW